MRSRHEHIFIRSKPSLLFWHSRVDHQFITCLKVVVPTNIIKVARDIFQYTVQIKIAAICWLASPGLCINPHFYLGIDQLCLFTRIKLILDSKYQSKYDEVMCFSDEDSEMFIALHISVVYKFIYIS